MIKVTIVLPLYNGSSSIKQCINSVCNQTYPHWELLVINDGSTDDSPHIVEEYAQLDNRIRIVHQKNQGISSTKNNALNLIQTEYFGFIDQDDYLGKEHIEHLVSYAAKFPEAQVISGGYTAVYKDHQNQICPDAVYHKTGIEAPNVPFFRWPLWSKLWRSSFFKSHQLQIPEGLNQQEDVITMIALLPHISRIVFIPTSDYYHTYLGDNTHCRMPNEKEANAIYRQFIRYSGNLWPHFLLLRAYQNDFLHDVYYYIYTRHKSSNERIQALKALPSPLIDVPFRSGVNLTIQLLPLLLKLKLYRLFDICARHLYIK